MSYFARHDLNDLNRREVYNLCNAADSRRLFKATGILSKQEADGINYMLRTLVRFPTDSSFDKFEALVTSHENLLSKEKKLEFEVEDIKRLHKGFVTVAELRLFLIIAGQYGK